ncbi:phenylacetate--CoA ligase family protein [Chloroflexota bacterium]
MSELGEFHRPEIETMAGEELERLQMERLRWQLRRCYEGSEFYRSRFDEIGLKPEDIDCLEDVQKIPPVTKDELREEQINHPPLGRYTVAPQKDWRELHPSTGTTGVPVNTIWTEKDVENVTDWTARTMWMSGVRPGDIVQNSFAYGLWVAGMSTHYAAKQIGCFVLPIGATMTERQIEYFQKPGSTVMFATPSYALYLAEGLRQKGISPDQIPLRMGIFGGEGGTEVGSTRRKIEEGLGIDAYDYYGLAEIGPTISSECKQKDGLHWVEDHVLIEIVDRDTKKRCAPGEMGVLVMTHLTKEGTPLIRYWTNDYAQLVFDKCACGRTHARSPGGILGRADDMIIYKGENFYPAQVEKVARSFPQLSAEYIIRLDTHERSGADVVTVVVECVEAEAGTEELKSRLRQALREELVVTPEIELVEPGTLPRTEFKAKRIEDRRKKD